jgi:hypothetical protein
MKSRSSIFLTLAAAFALAPSPASAQDAQSLVGRWSGDVTEAIDGRTDHYGMVVSIDTDRNGQPVASVSYSLECQGVWTGVQAVGDGWRFEETITAGRANCASHVDVELTAEPDGLHVRLYPVGAPQQHGEGVLRRTG